MGNKGSIKESDVLDLAWKYFQLHAQQRLLCFNFFVVFSSLMTTGLVATFKEKYEAHFIGFVIGLILSLISFIFYKIDQRNKFLIKHGENVIKEIEDKYKFENEYNDTNKLKIFI
jgi:amino acid permease